ncbi:2-dehydropantoate 2-reductase [Lacimicrobium sp. SS2-24]|uniref:ketopantoate reductase family protein n=1 Tax=Lacimicrobium sp. SS2-24 TaxID=2005569 RepID=UPI001FEEA7BF|nr:2-dehydropantoate 2-reductase [Lacimicrobium sp. SS2-24]
MKIVILGQGAIGSLLAGVCQQAQWDYAVIPKAGPCQSRKLTRLDGQSFEWTPPQLLASQLRGDELLILPLKAFHMKEAAIALSPWLGQQPLVLLNNGMGVIEDVRRQLPDSPLIAAISKKAVYRNNNNIVETGKGITDLGWVSPALPGDISRDVEARLNLLLEPAQWHQELQPALWQKLAINAVINPLTALENVRNGALMGPQYREQIAQLNAETQALMQLKQIPGWEQIPARVDDVIQATAENYSSMHQDIRHKRRTEVDYINGYLVTQGQRAGLSMACHSAMWQRIKRLEAATTPGT